MTLYRYRAITEGGKKTGGVIDADTEAVAKERLRKEKILVTHLEALQEKRKELSLSPSLLLSFTREMGQLLRAGLPLYEALVGIEEKYRKQAAHPLFLDLSDRLKGGAHLSDTLQKYPRTFDDIYVHMVKAAEETGNLPHIFEALTELIQRQQRLKKQLISAATYPAFLGVFCLIVVTVLLFFVIPSMEELFEGRELHPVTQIVLSCSQFLRTHGLLFFSALATFGTSLFLFFRKKKMDTFLLHLPFLKGIILQSALVRFCRAASLLLVGGVPLLETLQLSRRVMHNAPLESVIANAERGIREGRSLSSEMKNSPLIPPLVTRMLAISEETGKTAAMMQNVADIYEEELEKNLHHLTAILQPALLLLIGLIVGVVLLAVLLPLTDVGSMLN